MKLQGVYYKRSWEKAPEGLEYMYEGAHEVLLYHYWLVFDEICLHIIPSDIELQVCDAPPEDAHAFFCSTNEDCCEAMHSSFPGAELTKILDIRDGELGYFFYFDNGGLISLEKFWGTMMEPTVNAYWRMYFETPKLREDDDWLFALGRIILPEELLAQRSNVGAGGMPARSLGRENV